MGRNCDAKRCNRNSQCKGDEICSKEFKTFCFCKSSHEDDKRNRKGVCLKRCADIR